MRFQDLSDCATYFDDLEDLLYDSRRDPRVQYEHIVNDHIERFPEALRADESRRTETVRQAVQHALFRVEQDYKTAIHQYRYLRDRSDPGETSAATALISS
jgi:hypothetical protein